jgi:hypothetical protein
MYKFRMPVGVSDWIFSVASNWVLSMELAYFHPSGAQNIEMVAWLFDHLCTTGLKRSPQPDYDDVIVLVL